MPLKPQRPLRYSLIAWFCILLFIIAGIWQYRLWEGPGIRPITSGLILWWAAGLVAVFFQRAAGFALPDVKKGGWKKIYLLPLIAGILFAIADVVVFEMILSHPPYQHLPPHLQPFPYSIFLYFTGAFYVDIMTKLLPMTLIMAVAGTFLLGRKQNIVFWVAACIAAMYEPLEQMPAGPSWLIAYSLVAGFAFNLLAIYFLRKYGWITGMLVRIGHYLLWHIIAGICVEQQLNF